MKREQLEKLGLEKDVIDQIMDLHGEDLEKHKQAADTSKTEIETLKAQLGEANKAVESFKALDIDGIRKAADDYKAKAEAAEKAAAEQIAALRFDHALNGALAGAKVKDPVSVKANLKLDLLKLAEDGTISGLNDQLTRLKTDKEFLFEADTATPRIVAGAQGSSTIQGDPAIIAMRKAAGLPDLK